MHFGMCRKRMFDLMLPCSSGLIFLFLISRHNIDNPLVDVDLFLFPDYTPTLDLDVDRLTP